MGKIPRHHASDAMVDNNITYTMSEIKIKCPTCGKVLRLADKPNINQASFTCPVCKDKHVVGKCQRIMNTPLAEETQYSTPQSTGYSSGEETQIGGYSQRSDETQIGFAPQGAGCLVDTFGRSYPLRPGVNTIGRRAQTSTATIQIQTDDHYMSRNHAIIEVRQVGGKTICLLKNWNNKNSSYLNGTLVASGDQLVLNNGDRMRFGKTELTFKR